MTTKDPPRTKVGEWGPILLPWLQFGVGSLIWAALTIANQNLTFGILLGMSFAFFSTFTAFWKALQHRDRDGPLAILTVWLLFLVGLGMWVFLGFYGSRLVYPRVVSAIAATVFSLHAIVDLLKSGTRKA